MRVGLMISICLMASCLPEASSPPGRECSASATELDFGEVDSLAGAAVARSTVKVFNPLFTRPVFVEPLEAPFFVLPRGNAVLPGTGSADFTVSFAPRDALLHHSVLRLTELDPSAGVEPCNLTVPLRGLGRGSVVVRPSPIDFGFLEPGQEKTIELQLENQQRNDVQVALFIDGELSVFTMNWSSASVLAPREVRMVQLTARPQAYGPVRANLVLETSFSREATPMLVVGGVPRAEVLPTEFDLPRVGFEVDSSPRGFAQRAIRIRNVGTSDGSDEAALRLVNFEGLRSIHVEAIDGGSTDELRFTQQGTLHQGLRAWESGEVSVRLEPKGLGPRHYRITLHTNAPEQPEHIVMLQTVIEALPRCSMQVEPTGDFQLAPTPDGGSSAFVTFTNTGLEPCFVDNLRLTATTEPGYSIVGEQHLQVEVPAGARHTVTIAGPRGATSSHVGSLSFHIFNANSFTEGRPFYATP